MTQMIKVQMSHDLRLALSQLSEVPPQAYALIKGSPDYPNIWGTALMYPCWGGTLFLAEIQGLPSKDEPCGKDIYGFHIHNGAVCCETPDDFFSHVGEHWNPGQCPHPAHAGDLPPLFGSCGYALTLFYTRNFLPEETIGHTLIVHDMLDDFTTHPSGNSGKKIACGEIVANEQMELLP